MREKEMHTPHRILYIKAERGENKGEMYQSTLQNLAHGDPIPRVFSRTPKRTETNSDSPDKKLSGDGHYHVWSL